MLRQDFKLVVDGQESKMKALRLSREGRTLSASLPSFGAAGRSRQEWSHSLKV